MHCLCHKNVYFDDYACMSKFFEPIGLNRRTTRACNTKTMKVPVVKSVKGRQAIRYRGPVSWNTVDNCIGSIENYNSFRNTLLKKILPSFDDHPT